MHNAETVSLLHVKNYMHLSNRFLMCYLVYTNYQRQGAVVNMTMKEPKNAETKDEFKVVSVWDHKTATSHGAARIVMPKRIHQHILDQSPGGGKQHRSSVQNCSWGEGYSPRG